jgi:arylsulfatase A-like enzyme
VAFAAAAYDDCIADLDEYLGSLFDELKERGVLEQTWLFIVSDHGESFGEHAGVFCHGSSLYQTELHVPLLIVPPRARTAKRVVTETVSLRDLAATIVDVLALEAGSPFPGASLARFWTGAKPAPSPDPVSAEPALAEVLPSDRSNLDSYGMPKKSWPLGALTEGEWSYIRREGDVREELFHLRTDARQQRDLAGDPAAQPTLRRMRAALGDLTAGPLLPERFSR